MDNDTVKKNLESIRVSRHMTQEEMADALGVARNTYRNIEKGATKLISPTVMKIAEFNDMTPEEVVLGYLPIMDKDGTLRDIRDRHNERVNAITEEYEAKLKTLRDRIEHQEALIQEKDSNIRILNSYVAMLEKRIEEQKND